MNILELMRERLAALLTERNAVDDQANALFDAMAAEQRSEPNRGRGRAARRVLRRGAPDRRAAGADRAAHQLRSRPRRRPRAAADATIVSLRTNPARRRPAPARCG